MRKLKILLAVALSLSAQLRAENKDSLSTTPEKNIRKTRLQLPTDERTSRSVIKMNVTQMAFRNFYFQYEFAFHKNMSGALGASFLIPRNIPKFIYNPPSSTEGWQLPKFSGFSITPEFRYYPGKKEKNQAPHGLYAAAYLRYSKFILKADYLDLTSSGATNQYNVVATFSGYNGGIMLGNQWIINKHLSIDLWVIGWGIGKAKFQMEAKETTGNLNMTGQDQSELVTDIQNHIDDLARFSNGVVAISTTINSAKVVIKDIPMTSVRAFGFCIGFAF